MDRDAIVSDYLATDERIHAIFERLLSSPTYREELKDTYPTTHAPLAATMDGSSRSWTSDTAARRSG